MSQLGFEPRPPPAPGYVLGALTTELLNLGRQEINCILYSGASTLSSEPCDRLPIHQHIQVRKIVVVPFRPVWKNRFENAIKVETVFEELGLKTKLKTKAKMDTKRLLWSPLVTAHEIWREKHTSRTHCWWIRHGPCTGKSIYLLESLIWTESSNFFCVIFQ